MARAESQTAITPEKETDSFKTVEQPATNTEAKKNVLLAQKQAPLETSSKSSANDIKSIDEEAGTIPEKYNLDNELKALDRITLFDIKSFENIDRQSLILRTNYSDYYLLVLRRPRIEVSYGKTYFDYQGSTIIAGYDRVIMNYPDTQYYTIDKIYELKGRKQVTEIKERLRDGQDS